ncbi:MAG: NUDIX domain-containing protein [Elusimicrobiota bacterium]
MPALEKKVLAGFGRAALSSAWWKRRAGDVKFCLRCGGKLAWRLVREENCRRRVCGQCRFIAYQNPLVVAAALPERAGKIYLLRRGIEPSRGLWTFPGGYMEMGETAEQAAARETLEEIHARVKITGLHNVYSYADAGVVTLVYRARVLGPEPRPSPEAQCVEAFRAEDIPWRELAFRSTFHALREWVAGARG